MDGTSQSYAYLWQVDGKRVSVSLSLSVVDGLSQAAEEGIQALPRRRMETGGFLLGRTRRGRGRSTVVEVEAFEPLVCEHAFGPSYLLSIPDRVGLEARLAARGPRGGHSIVGFYRTHTRRELAATVEDVDLLSSYFSDPSQVFLLIHDYLGRHAPFFTRNGVLEKHLHGGRPLL